MKARALALALLLAAQAAHAVQPGEQLADPALEARARALSANLRCMVCQNQSIDDSDAALARDVRVLVRERLVAGDSDAAIEAFMVSRYGDFVLLKPPLNAGTLGLWVAPFAVLGLGALALLVMARRRRVPTPAAPLSAQERARLAEMLEEGGRGG